MTSQDLHRILERLEIHPSTRLGQNFLIDPNLCAALVRDAAPQPGETIVEVGPGTGAITEPLLETGARILAIELDRRLCEYLRERFAERANFTLVEADACRLDYQKLLNDRPCRLIANLPYSAGTVLLGKLFALEHPPEEAFILLQREVADRLLAKPGTKAYGSLTVRSQVIYECHRLRQVPGRVFFPEPGVISSHLRLRRRATIPSRAQRESLSVLARVAFGQRRKKLLGVLRKNLPAVDWQSLFDQLGISSDARAETLPPALFLKLASALQSIEKPETQEESNQ